MRVVFVVLLALVATACQGKKALEKDPRHLDSAHRQRQAPWDAAVVDAMGRLPVQDGGRVKPLSTVAQVALLGINGNRDLRFEWTDAKKESLSATEWLLDCFFYPEQAKHYRCLRVDNDEAITALGLRFPERKRLDRYSYDEIVPAHERLARLAHQFHDIEPKKRTPVQGQLVDLYEALHVLDRMLGFLDFARRPIELHRSAGLARTFPGESKRPLSFLLQNLHLLSAMAQVMGGEQVAVDAATKAKEVQALQEVFEDFERATEAGSALALFAPVAADQETWWMLRHVVADAAEGKKPAPAHLAIVTSFEQMVAKREQADEFRAAALACLDAARSLAAPRGEYRKIGIEVSYYRGDFFYRALLVFGFAFVLAALSWLRPTSRWLPRGVALGTLVAWSLLVVGIVYRCVIRSRPPVSTLYETILFISAVGVAVGLVMERINRQRIGITLAAFLGMLGMFLARKFEELEGIDTMPQLVAVLDTNFWLSTHVTTVTMGYSAGLLAALLAQVYVFTKLFGARPTMLRNVSRMIYGAICFGLFFSVVGTILGGVWANYSWGRFWGWDPKENGALLICLFQIAILHGRMSGWLREQGLAMAAIVLGVVVAFSWWHVNQLGVGLHSYGFTEGILTSLYWFYGSQAVVFALGLVAWTRAAPAGAAVASAPPDSVAAK